MIEAMKFWVDQFDIDGFRCDLAFWVELNFWKQAKAALDQVKPLFWLAEADALEHASYLEVFDAAYSWKWMHQTADYYQDKIQLSELVSLLDQYKSGRGLKAWFTSNHDENSWNGTEYEKYEIIAKALMAFSCTWPGIPLIYSGQELPLLKRLKFFDKDPIEWTDTPHLHHFYKTLLQLQATHPALNARVGVEMISNSSFDKVISYIRKHENREVLMIINFSRQHLHVDLYADYLQGEFINVFTQEIFNLSSQKQFQIEPGGFWALVK
jgi:glycosidase